MAAGIMNHAMSAAQMLMGSPATPADSSTTGTSGTASSSDASSDSATISSNDFLTLLVTEMQNQDPTADTDPNEYINQLVEVNSLEQLIDINQTLTTGLDGTPASSGNDGSGQVAGAGSGTPSADAVSSNVLQRIAPGAAGGLPAIASEARLGSAAVPHAPGNLSIPGAAPAAQRVAHALDGRVRAQPDTSILAAAH
jgi:flagellar basal-body rod modification protein FlgD